MYWFEADPRFDTAPRFAPSTLRFVPASSVRSGLFVEAAARKAKAPQERPIRSIGRSYGAWDSFSSGFYKQGGPTDLTARHLRRSRETLESVLDGQGGCGSFPTWKHMPWSWRTARAG